MLEKVRRIGVQNKRAAKAWRTDGPPGRWEKGGKAR